MSERSAATYIVAIMSMLSSMTLGSPARSGRLLFTPSSAVFTFTRAESMFVSSSNSSITML